MSWNTPLLLLLACGAIVALAACTDGYPREDALDDSRMSVSAHVKALNRYLAESESTKRLARQDSCHLLLRKRGEATAGTPSSVIALLRSQVDVRSDPAGGLRIQLTQTANGQPRVALKLDVDSWIDAVAWRSHFQQLQIHCRETRSAS